MHNAIVFCALQNTEEECTPRSGKTSIHRVLFDDAVPKETFYLEPTARIEKHIYEFAVYPCPTLYLC